MAAIVDRPLSAMGATMDPVVQQRRRRESVEIIDVDSLDDATITGSRQADVQPRQRHLGRRIQAINEVGDPETIVVLDSDEEDLVVGTPEGERRASRTRLFSPPPQPHRPSPVPPVPPVPSRYAGHTSLRMRLPVRAIARPFDFEANNNHPGYPVPDAVGHRPPADSHPLRAAASSHHVPSMGLGGALLSSYREAQQRQNSHHNHPQPGFLARAGAAAGGLANRISRNLANYGLGPGINGSPAHIAPPRHNNTVARMLIEAEMQEMFGQGNHQHLLRHFMRDHLPQNAMYQTTYTHPRPPEPGFTHDFAPEQTLVRPTHVGPIVIDDDDVEAGPSSSKQNHRAHSPVSVKSSMVLVCARCLDPLVLSAGLVGENVERRKVWGLRCGHMIDGKCLKVIGQPAGDISEGEHAVKTYAKGKAKSRASLTKGKGKGKAKAMDEEFMTESEIPEHDDDDASAIISSPSPPGDNSIRSRLRSSRTSRNSSGPYVPVSPSTSPATTRRRRPRKPKIEGEYRYVCPVVGCEHVHVSVKVNGVWRPEQDNDRKKPGGRRAIKFPGDLVVGGDGSIDVRGRGAIPIFV